MNVLYLKPVRTQFEFDTLLEKANDDQHLCVAPSHSMTRGGETVGYFAIGTMPITYCWFSTQAKLTPREVLEYLTRAEHIFFEKFGPGRTIIPCPKDSPFHALLTQERGYLNVGNYDLFIKEI